MHVHQFHVDPETGDIQQTISLGFYDKDLQPEQSETQILETPTPARGASTQPKFYVKALYSDGSKCALEDKVRLLLSPHSLYEASRNISSSVILKALCNDEHASCSRITQGRKEIISDLTCCLVKALYEPTSQALSCC